MKILEITPELRPRFGPRIQALEATATYPLGTDRFRIDHGPDYFAFFERMGELLYLAAIEHDEVIAVGACVLRNVPLVDARESVKAWYLCDLKVRPERRGEGLPERLLQAGLERASSATTRAYAVTMHPAGGAPNRVVRLLSRFPIPLEPICELDLYSLAPSDLVAIEPLLVRFRGPLVLASLRGVKDLVLESTRAPMPLVHVRFDGGASGGASLGNLPPDSACMFCVPREDVLARALRERGHAPSAGATIIAHDLDRADWRFVVTSEI